MKGLLLWIGCLLLMYMLHLVYGVAKRGWNVVVSNHRGLGGISMTSDCFYNAGWTEDLREVVNHLHKEYPKAPLFAIGTSIGANVLVKYLGEDGDTTPFAGAAAICSPWDLLTVDSYYRRCSSSSYVGSVSIPLLCISALDDPLCTKEAIPWDECRTNKNIVLATTTHGGHLAFFQGLSARSLWWVGAVNEYLGVLRSSPYMHTPKKTATPVVHPPLESSIDKSPYVNLTEDGMVAAMIKECGGSNSTGGVFDGRTNYDEVTENRVAVTDLSEQRTEVEVDPQSSRYKALEDRYTNILHDIAAPVNKSINKISRQSGTSMWLLAYIAVVTSWPLVGSILLIVFRKKLGNVLPAAWLRR